MENHEASNSSDVNISVPALGVAPVAAEEKSQADPADSIGRSALMQQLTKPADEMLQVKIETSYYFLIKRMEICTWCQRTKRVGWFNLVSFASLADHTSYFILLHEIYYSVSAEWKRYETIFTIKKRPFSREAPFPTF